MMISQYKQIKLIRIIIKNSYKTLCKVLLIKNNNNQIIPNIINFHKSYIKYNNIDKVIRIIVVARI